MTLHRELMLWSVMSGRKNTGWSLVIVDREVDVIKTSSNFGSWGSRRLDGTWDMEGIFI